MCTVTMVTLYLLNTALAVVGFLTMRLVAPVVPTVDTSFLERDPSLSHQRHDTISAAANRAIVLGVPGVVIFVISFWNHYRSFGLSRFSLCNYVKSVLPMACTLITSVAVTAMEVRVIKLLIGSKRPCFYDMCNYKGYHDALKSGNFTTYLQSTTAHNFGDIQFCQTITRDAMESFVSSHAAIAFAGLGSLSLWIYYSTSWNLSLSPDYSSDDSNFHDNDILISASQHLSKIVALRFKYLVRGLLSSLPLFLAATIASTRVWDNLHRPLDVSLGAVIGISNAFLVFNSWIIGDRAHVRCSADHSMKKLEPLSLGWPRDKLE